jgi:hypothetical protein
MYDDKFRFMFILFIMYVTIFVKNAGISRCAVIHNTKQKSFR